MSSLKIQLKHPRLLAALVLATTVFLLYSVSLGHNFLFDEDNIILLNPALRDPSQWTKIFTVGFFQRLAPGSEVAWNDYYRPLTLFTFALDYWKWNVNPLGYNLTNTALHLVTCLLFFVLLCKIFNHTWAAFLGAFVFSIHTIHTEAVTYIASRGDLISALIIVTAMLCYWKGWGVAVWLVYALAPFAKESGVLLPLYLLILDISFIKTPFKKLVQRFLPLVLIGAGYFLFRKFGSPVPLGPGHLDSGAFYRFLSMGTPFFEYMRALIAPEYFRYCGGILFAGSIYAPPVKTTLVVLVCLAAAWFLALRYRGAAFFGLNLFLLSYGPSLQIVHYYPEWAEHYLYVPLMGLVILLSGLIKNVLESPKKWVIGVLAACYIPWVSFIGLRTVQRNLLYNDMEKYYTLLSRSPSPYAYFGYINLARFLCEKGKWDEAFVPLKTALKIERDSELNHFNLGLYYNHKKNYKRAVSFFKKAYKMGKPRQPIFLLSAVKPLNQMGQSQAAIRALNTVYPKVKEEWSVYRDYLRAYEHLGQVDKAFEWGDRGIIETAAKPQSQAAVIMELILLAHRENRPQAYEKYAALLLEKHSETPWFGDLARFLNQKTTDEEYRLLVDQKYPTSREEAKFYRLVGLVQQGDVQASVVLGQINPTQIENLFDDPRMVRKTLAQAEVSIKK